jgi:hypothetical protein
MFRPSLTFIRRFANTIRKYFTCIHHMLDGDFFLLRQVVSFGVHIPCGACLSFITTPLPSNCIGHPSRHWFTAYVCIIVHIEHIISYLGVKGGRRVRLTTLPLSVSRLSREDVGALTSQNPIGLHGLLQV